MITVEPLRDQAGTLRGFHARGHSQTAPAGEDPLCASVSTLFEVLSSGVQPIPDSGRRVWRNEDTPEWVVLVTGSDYVIPPELQGVFETVHNVFSRLDQSHGDGINLKDSQPYEDYLEGGDEVGNKSKSRSYEERT